MLFSFVAEALAHPLDAPDSAPGFFSGLILGESFYSIQCVPKQNKYNFLTAF